MVKRSNQSARARFPLGALGAMGGTYWHNATLANLFDELLGGTLPMDSTDHEARIGVRGFMKRPARAKTADTSALSAKHARRVSALVLSMVLMVLMGCGQDKPKAGASVPSKSTAPAPVATAQTPEPPPRGCAILKRKAMRQGADLARLYFMAGVEYEGTVVMSRFCPKLVIRLARAAHGDGETPPGPNSPLPYPDPTDATDATDTTDTTDTDAQQHYAWDPAHCDNFRKLAFTGGYSLAQSKRMYELADSMCGPE